MALVRFILRALLIAVGLGLIAGLLLPGGARIVDIATAVLAAATWIVPLGAFAYRSSRWPKTSLAAVGVWSRRLFERFGRSTAQIENVNQQLIKVTDSQSTMLATLASVDQRLGNVEQGLSLVTTQFKSIKQWKFD